MAQVDSTLGGGVTSPVMVKLAVVLTAKVVVSEMKQQCHYLVRSQLLEPYLVKMVSG